MTRFALPLLACFAFAGPAAAGDKAFDAEALLKPYAPFIDEHTMAFARIDFAAITPELIENWAQRLAPYPEMLKGLEPLLTRWKAVDAAGLKSLAIAWGPGDMPYPPCMLFETREGAMLGTVSRLVGPNSWFRGQERIEYHHGLLCIGEPAALANLKRKKPADRPEFRAALNAAGPGVFHFAYAMDEGSRKIIEELAPELPESFGGGPTTQFTRSLTWMSGKVDLSGKGVIRIVARTKDADAAKRLRDQQKAQLDARLADLQKRDPVPGGLFPKLKKAIDELTEAKIAGGDLILEREIESSAKELIALGLEILEAEKKR